MKRELGVLLVVAVVSSAATALRVQAQVEDLLACALHPAYKSASCPICNRDEKGEEEADCRRAKQVLLGAATSPYRGDRKRVGDLSCLSAKLFARAYGFKTARELREEHDAAAAKGIDEETKRIRDVHRQVVDQRDRQVTEHDSAFWEGRAKAMDAQADQSGKKASAAFRAGDYKQFHAYSDAERESRNQAHTARSFANESRVRGGQSRAGPKVDDAVKAAVDDHEARNVRNVASRYSRERLGNRRGQASSLNEYKTLASEPVKQIEGVGEGAAPLVRGIGSRTNELLNVPSGSDGASASAPRAPIPTVDREEARAKQAPEGLLNLAHRRRAPGSASPPLGSGTRPPGALDGLETGTAPVSGQDVLNAGIAGAGAYAEARGGGEPDLPNVGEELLKMGAAAIAPPTPADLAAQAVHQQATELQRLYRLAPPKAEQSDAATLADGFLDLLPGGLATSNARDLSKLRDESVGLIGGIRQAVNQLMGVDDKKTDATGTKPAFQDLLHK